jgi:F-box protein 33
MTSNALRALWRLHSEQYFKTSKMAAAQWEQLPSSVFVQILSYLPLTDRLNATSVCRTWRGCLFQPCLWRSIAFSVNNIGRKRARLLSKTCARFTREVRLHFSANCADIKDTLRILLELTTNSNLERLTLRPSSCQLAWPEREANNCKHQ